MAGDPLLLAFTGFENAMLGKRVGGRYEIVRLLGTGGFGQTYIAKDLHRPGEPTCVVKHLKPVVNDPEFWPDTKRLFLKEAEVLEKLGSHDQIPRLLAYFEEDQQFFLVQELIEGHVLSDELRSHQPWSEAATLLLLRDICAVLHFVHQERVIHRDIKPSNLMRRKHDHKIILIDFGAVKQIAAAVSTTTWETTTVAVGSPGYMPLEQVSGRPRLNSDVYAVGLIGIQALTGLTPSQIPTDPVSSELLWKDRAKHISPGFAQVLQRMVRYDHRERYSSAGDVLVALEALMQGEDPSLSSAPTRGLVAASASSPSPQAQSHSPLGSSASASRPKRRIPWPTVAGLGVGSLTAIGVGVVAVWMRPLSLSDWANNLSLRGSFSTQTPVRVLAVSSTEDWLVSAGDDGVVKVWDPKTQQRIATLGQHPQGVESLTVSTDGQLLASGGSDAKIELWDLRRRQALTTLNGKTGSVQALAFTPQKLRLASGGSNGAIEIWDPANGQLQTTLNGFLGGNTPEEGVTSLAFSPDGKTLYSAYGTTTVLRWSLPSINPDTPLSPETLTSPYPVEQVLVDPRGGLITGSPDGIRFWGTQKRPTATLEQRFTSLSALALSRDGQLLVGGTDFRQPMLILWQAQTQEQLATLKPLEDTVSAIVLSSDEKTLYSGSVDGTIKIWRP